MNRNQTVIVGLAMIIIGAYILLAEYGLPFRIHASWPVILMVIGAALIAAFFFTKPRVGYLFAGSLIFWLGIFFMLIENMLEHYYGYARLWPGFLIVVGLAHLSTALLAPSQAKHLGGAVFFLAMGSVFFYFTFTGWQSIRFDNIVTIIAIFIIFAGFKLVLDFFLILKERR
jgi:hypothetical protein